MPLHRELEIMQKSAWFMLQRLRKAAEVKSHRFAGPVEVGETYVGGRRRNMHNAKHKELYGREAISKTAGAGMARKRLKYDDLIADNWPPRGAR